MLPSQEGNYASYVVNMLLSQEENEHERWQIKLAVCSPPYLHCTSSH
jgi:hypothetical protein